MNQKLRLVLISVLIALAAALPGAGRAQSQTVYSGAVKDFLRPMEAFSRERKTEPELVMIHFISAVVDRRDDPFNLGSIRRIFLDGGISVHYLVDREGTVRCYVPEDRTALHAGRGEWADEKYTNRINRYSIGIEVAAIGSRQDMARYLTAREYDALDDRFKGYTDAQYDALKRLVEDICRRYGIPPDREHVIGHQDYSPSKNDPGELFDWSRILPQPAPAAFRRGIPVFCGKTGQISLLEI